MAPLNFIFNTFFFLEGFFLGLAQETDFFQLQAQDKREFWAATFINFAVTYCPLGKPAGSISMKAVGGTLTLSVLQSSLDVLSKSRPN